MSLFKYPTLSIADIVGVLAESEIATVSPSDITRPTPEFVQTLYAKILLELETLEDDLGDIDFAALEQLENPEILKEETVRTMNLCNKVRQLLAALEFTEQFNLRDLLRPEPTRTERFLSALLNFLIHKNTKMDFLRPIVEEITLLDEQRKEFEIKLSELEGGMREKNEAREREVPLVQEVEAKVIELRQTISALNNQQMSLRTTFRKMKETSKEMDEKISKAEFTLVQTVQENADLRSKIVQSPEKLQRALEERRSDMAEAENSERAAMQSCQEKTSTVEVYTKAHKKMLKLLSEMKEIQDQVNSAKSVEKEVKALKAKLSDQEAEDKSFEAKLIERQGKAEQLDEARKQLEKEKDLKRTEASKKLDNVKLEVESRRCDLEARERKAEAVVLVVDFMVSKICSVNEHGVAKKQELFSKYEEVMKQFELYSNSIGGLIEKNEVTSSAGLKIC